MQRFWEIDALRGIAIIMMVLFHFLWDLKYFGFINFNLYSGFWGYFQVATASLFLLLAGMMVALGTQKYGEMGSFNLVKRGAFIFSVGVLITFVTYLIFPNDFIYFGILHLIGVSIIIAIPIAKRKLIPLIVGLIFIVLPLLINLQSFGIDLLVWVGFAVPKSTLDFEPVIPWMGAFLVGVFLFNLFYNGGKRNFKLKDNQGFFSRKLQFLGKKSLVIYLVHQPVMFLIVYLVTLFFH